MKAFSTVVSLRAVRSLLATGVMASSLVVASAATANAQINFAGSTQFSFNGSPFSSFVTVFNNGLTLTGTNFNVVTTPVTSHVSFSNLVLGQVHLIDRLHNYTGDQVRMLVTLTNPTAANQIFTSTLTGLITPCTKCHPGQSVFIDWAAGNPALAYTNGPGQGTFDMEVDDTNIILGVHNATITGEVTVTASPEPASLVLLGTGLLGVFGVAARRRKA